MPHVTTWRRLSGRPPSACGRLYVGVQLCPPPTPAMKFPDELVCCICNARAARDPAALSSYWLRQEHPLGACDAADIVTCSDQAVRARAMTLTVLRQTWA